MSGECNFLGSVLPQQRFEMVDQCYSSLLQLRVLFSKQRIVHHQGVRVGQPKKERPQPLLAPSFYMFSPFPHEPALCKLGLARKGACLFHLRSSLLSMDFLFPFSRLFPFFVCILVTVILDSFSYYNYLKAGFLCLFCVRQTRET